MQSEIWTFINPGIPIRSRTSLKVKEAYKFDFPGRPQNRSLQMHTSIVNATYKGFVEIILVNNDTVVQSFHLEGYSVFVVGMAYGEWTPNSRNSYNKHDAVFRYTTQPGGDVNAGDHTGQTTLHWSVVRGAVQVAEILLQEGGSVGAADMYGYQLMCLADLELDFINLYDLAARINKLNIDEALFIQLLEDAGMTNAQTAAEARSKV